MAATYKNMGMSDGDSAHWETADQKIKAMGLDKRQASENGIFAKSTKKKTSKRMSK